MAFCVKIIFVAINYFPGCKCKFAGPVVNIIGAVIFKRTSYKGALFIEEIIMVFNYTFAGCCFEGYGIKIILCISKDPTGAYVAFNKIIFCVLGFNKSGTGDGFAAFTNEFAVFYFIFMSGCRNESAPFKNRTAAVVGIAFMSEIFNSSACAANTEYAVFISGFSAGCSFALCSSGSADMEAPFVLSVCIGIITVHFGLDYSFVCRESCSSAVSISYNTCFCADYKSVISGTVGIPHSMGGKDIIFILFCRIVGNIVFADAAVVHPAFCHPDSDRKFCKNSGICNFFTGAGKGNYRIVMFIDIIFSLETGSNFHAFKFPIIDVVKIDSGGNGFYGFKVICNKIYPINGTGRNKTIGSRNFKTNIALIGVYGKFAYDGTNVALVIGNFHNDGVNTVVEVKSVNGDGSACGNCNRCAAENAVNINFDRVAVKAGCIGLAGIFISLRHKGYGVGVYGLAGNFNTVGIFINNGHAGEIGIFTVDNCIGIVNGNIIDIVGDILIIVVVYSCGCGIVAVNLDIFKSSVVIKNIPAEIIPAAVIGTGCVSEQIFYFMINTSSSGSSSHACRNLHGSGYDFCGHIKPETYGSCISKIEGFRKEDFNLSMAGCGNVGPVDVKSHSFFAVSDKSGFFIYKADLRGDIHTDGSIFCSCNPSVRIVSVLTGIAYMPAIDVFSVIFSIIAADVTGVGSIDGELAVFEVISDFGSFAETDFCGNFFVFLSADHSGNGTAGKSGAFIASGKLITNDGTELFIGKSINDIAVFMGYGVASFVGGNFDRKIHGIAITDNNGFISESDFGNNDSNSCFTDYFAFINHLSGYGTDSTIGGEYTGFADGTHIGFNKLPGNIFRDFCRVTYEVGADSFKLNFAVGGIIYVACADGCLCKFSVCRSSGNEADTGSGRTKATVGRRVVDLKFFTGTLGNESGRTAAVAVCCKNTSCRKHNFCTFVHIHTCGERRLTAVVEHHNYFTVCSNADYGTGSAIVFVSSFCLVSTVFYNVSAGNRDNGFFPTVKVIGRTNLRHFYFRNVSRSGVSVFIKIFVDNYTGGETDISVVITAVCRVKHDFAVKHHKTERFTEAICGIAGIPGKAAVHYADNFAFHVLVDPVSLIKHGAGLILRGVHFSIGRNDINKFVVNVRLHDMNYLAVIACIIVKNDFRLVDTGSVFPVCFGDEVIILICALCSVVRIIKSCKSGNRHYTDCHYERKKQRQNTFHFFFPPLLG